MRSLLLIFLIVISSCTRELLIEKQVATEEIATAKPIFDKNCFTVCDINTNPDLQLVTNAEEDTLYPDGSIDSGSYFFTKYGVRTNPIRLTQNFLTRGIHHTLYGWDSGVYINMIRLQCLVENIASFDPTCKNDWKFKADSTMGYLVNNLWFFDGLFQFDTYEKGNGNNWKFLTSDFKKEFNPSNVPARDYILNTNFCYYFGIGERAIQAQMGDFYYNYFRLPNHDGIYKIVLKFNPLIKGCRAIKETNYNNNEKTVYLEIRNGQVFILSL